MTLGPILLAILPVFVLIFIGYGCRAGRILADAFWEPVERLTYFVLFPSLLITTLSSAQLSGLSVLPMAAALIAALLIMTAILLLLKPLLAIGGPAFTSIFQGAVRQNTYIGLAVAFGLFGDAGLAAAAVAVAAIVPTVNVLCVAMLARYGDGAPPSARGTAVQIIKNPLIIACVIGITLHATGLGLPPVIKEVLAILGRAALPLGLLAVGAALNFSSVRSDGHKVALASLLKLVLLPAITALACWVLGVTGIAAAVAVMFNGLPTAIASYILARQLGGDAKLMAGIVTVQTALGIVTLPVILTLRAFLA